MSTCAEDVPHNSHVLSARPSAFLQSKRVLGLEHRFTFLRARQELMGSYSIILCLIRSVLVWKTSFTNFLTSLSTLFLACVHILVVAFFPLGWALYYFLKFVFIAESIEMSSFFPH